MSTGYTASLRLPHAVWITRSGARDDSCWNVWQLRRWIDTPRPRVTNPTISSGGAGLQQRDICVINESTPTTSTPLLAPRATLVARLFLVTASSSLNCGCASPSGCRSACSTWRRLNSSFATAANSSSGVLKWSRLARSSRLTAVLPSRCKVFSISARPCAMVSCESSALNHARTLARARLLAR
ncbi:hypothetical protein D3C86_1640850 [compost metagenome]